MVVFLRREGGLNCVVIAEAVWFGFYGLRRVFRFRVFGFFRFCFFC